MANLIIKPTSGGLLKLQEDGGTDAISIGTDGKSTITHANITAWTPPAGCLLQVVQGTHHAESASSTSTSFVATGISVAITPSAASSKVLISASTSIWLGDAGYVSYSTIYRGSTNLGDSTTGLESFYSTGNVQMIVPHSLSVLDHPNTTSATTYTIYARCINGTYQFQNTDRAHAFLTAMEVAG